MSTISQPAQPRTVQRVGSRALRKEDRRLLLGDGRFVDDIDLPDQLYARIVRSTVAHGELTGIDATYARLMPGVCAVIDGDDLADVGRLPLRWEFGEADAEFLQPVLARDRVRYVGEPVAVVVAQSPYTAEDAAETVVVEIEPLPAVVDARRGLGDEAQRLRDAGNEAALISMGWGDVDAAFRVAAHRVSLELTTSRQAAVPMETRGCLADYDAEHDRLWVWGPLNPSAHRAPLAKLLGMPESSVRLLQGDIGGNFGSRAGIYPEHVLIPYLSRLLQRPVKWQEDRFEHMVATSHAREQVHCVEAAFDAEGAILAVRDQIWHDIGAYVRPQGHITSEITVGLLCAPYRVPAYAGAVHAVTTNKTPICPYRGPGRFEGTFVRERLLDVAGRQLGLDPIELRRRNLLSPEELPFIPGIEVTGEPFELRDMDVPGALEKALVAADFAAWRREADALRAEGRVVGTGMAISVDKSGLGRYETGTVEIKADGRIGVVTGGFSVGQGIETVLAQIVGDEFGVPPSAVDVNYGDTELEPNGIGSFSSRTTVLGGSAVMLAARAVADKARDTAGRLLEASPADIVLVDGFASVVGAEQRRVSLDEVSRARAAATATTAENDGLKATHVFAAEAMNHPYGVTLVQVEVDRATGSVKVRRLFVAAEVGHAINPMLVEGQIVGGAAQGVGAALLEAIHYDDEGQPQSVTFIDYLMPTASEVPWIETMVLEDAPSSSNPLGAKGVGEIGGLGCGGAIANAIEDAIGIEACITRVPVEPGMLERLLRQQSDLLTETSPANS